MIGQLFPKRELLHHACQLSASTEYHLFNDGIYGTLRYQIDKFTYLGMLEVDHDEMSALKLSS